MQVNFYFLVQADRGTDQFAAGRKAPERLQNCPTSFGFFRNHDRVEKRWIGLPLFRWAPLPSYNLPFTPLFFKLCGVTDVGRGEIRFFKIFYFFFNCSLFVLQTVADPQPSAGRPSPLEGAAQMLNRYLLV